MGCAAESREGGVCSTEGEIGCAALREGWTAQRVGWDVQQRGRGGKCSREEGVGLQLAAEGEGWGV